MDGKLHHLKELDFIERQLYQMVSPEEFYKNLTKYIKESPAINIDKGFFTFEETQAVDKFIQNYFSNYIDDARIYFLRAYVIGKLLADTDIEAKPFILGTEQIAKMPKFIQEAVKRYNLSVEEAAAMNSTVERGAVLLSNAITNTQQQVKSALIEAIQRGEGNNGFEKRLKEMLIEETGELNRDWKRVAITETNNAFANGYLSVMQDGEYVIGVSMQDACPHCIDLLHLKVYKFLKEAPQDYTNLKGEAYEAAADIWENFIWEGKNNFGRSTSLRKRIDKTKGNKEDNLVYREHHELSMPVIPLHPYCRCRWIAFNPELQFIDNGEIKLKVEDPAKHALWYEENISGYGEKT